MSADIAIDLSDPTPPYEQLRRQFATMIETGQLVAGQRLPPVRQLAKDLGLANGTVARPKAPAHIMPTTRAPSITWRGPFTV